MLVSPAALLHQAIPVRAKCGKPAGVSPESELAAADAVSLRIGDWYPIFNPKDTMYRFDETLLRMRYSLLELPDLGATSSLEEKYFEPVARLVHCILLSPDMEHGPLQASWANGPEGLWRSARIGFHVADPDSDMRAYRRNDHGLSQEPGSIEAGPLPSRVPAGTKMNSLVMDAIAQCRQTHAVVGIITDEIQTLILRPGYPGDTILAMQVHPTAEVSIRRLIAFFIYAETFQARLCTLDGYAPSLLWLGAQPARVPKPLPQLLLRRSHEEFDVYRMQRSRSAWGEYVIWSEIYTQEAELSGNAPWKFVPGTRLPCTQLRIFGEGGINKWKPEGRPFVPVPPDTEALVMRHFRPRDNDLHGFLTLGPTQDTSQLHHWFEITGTGSVGPEKYSQTFWGRFNGVGPLLFLKLFDERFFPLPADGWDPADPPHERFLDFNLAIDMIRREEAAYKRVEYLQGSLLPHCYGFHKACGWPVYGMLVEAISGPTLATYMRNNMKPQHEQLTDLITRLRHALRALRFAGIHQTDWHLDQILCPPNPDDPALAPDIVMIDFAFALQSWGDWEGCPLETRPRELEHALMAVGIDQEVLRSCWFPATEEEL
ncbi:hypothetical protein GLOTRDRAFT_97024 [Gloeophyllum trabeum ATCC 11539]|uniref:Protein kinase domain-containing protein n=1 Tax=Gloeophyllum trabeum (strain ATCC 11539 / FP-39264 / Madison 617) TaxID=670483 RepID=S7PRC0_GLOTA|nr:uncharacterized protein GLOTRDRAFT_97024 [Gloeophyllum trabeum ATCC 11539]EPQ50406.1 hypothetical protein GLOTRDRAFT_97024 [Gloeophyllum trabeum ATCC 11539]